MRSPVPTSCRAWRFRATSSASPTARFPPPPRASGRASRNPGRVSPSSGRPTAAPIRTASGSGSSSSASSGNRINEASLGDLTVPALVISGDADLSTPPSIARMIAARIRNSELPGTRSIRSSPKRSIAPCWISSPNTGGQTGDANAPVVRHGHGVARRRPRPGHRLPVFSRGSSSPGSPPSDCRSPACRTPSRAPGPPVRRARPRRRYRRRRSRGGRERRGGQGRRRAGDYRRSGSSGIRRG